MPELPEVETIRNDLRKKILGKKITQVVVVLPRTVLGDKDEFKKILIGNSFKEIERTGKLLIFVLDKSKKYLLVHLKMTGQLIYCLKNKVIAGGHSATQADNSWPNKHSRVIFSFRDGSNLFFNDMRTFGYLKIVGPEELNLALRKFGINPLGREMNAFNLEELIKNKKAPIKAVLLNQEFIAGIGNIYADEILFAAGVRPDRLADSLKTAEIKIIARETKKILQRAIKYRGTTFNDYVDADGHQGKFSKLLKVYGRKGEKCSRCSGIVQKTKVAGRGTHFCSVCQK